MCQHCSRLMGAIKPADFLIQKIKITNDSRELKLRKKEIFSTVKGILRNANRDKEIEIGIGNEIIYPITLGNIQLDFSRGERADTSVVYLFIKTPISKKKKVESLISKINSFIEKSEVEGRSEIIKQGELILSIKNPGKYRKGLLSLIADDIEETISIFGDKYSAEINGLSQALQWERASVSELRLYLEYDFILVTK